MARQQCPQDPSHPDETIVSADFGTYICELKL